MASVSIKNHCLWMDTIYRKMQSLDKSIKVIDEKYSSNEKSLEHQERLNFLKYRKQYNQLSDNYRVICGASKLGTTLEQFAPNWSYSFFYKYHASKYTTMQNEIEERIKIEESGQKSQLCACKLS